MKKEGYEKLYGYVNERKAFGALRHLTTILTYSYVSAFAVLVIMLFRAAEYRTCAEIVLVSGVAFGLGSLLRKVVKAKRPYELMEFEPLLKREKTGDSLPSRHVFSAVLICAAMFRAGIYSTGILMLILSLVLAVVRVVGGVHFIKDVVLGILYGFLSAGLGYFVCSFV